MTDVPSLSVIVVCCNSERTIRACLQSLRQQTDSNFEPIVVDSSTDATAEIVEREFPWVKLLR
jgi:glycosyltransferase involved in cell wall biosynthesis